MFPGLHHWEEGAAANCSICATLHKMKIPRESFCLTPGQRGVGHLALRGYSYQNSEDDFTVKLHINSYSQCMLTESFYVSGTILCAGQKQWTKQRPYSHGAYILVWRVRVDAK